MLRLEEAFSVMRMCTETWYKPEQQVQKSAPVHVAVSTLQVTPSQGVQNRSIFSEGEGKDEKNKKWEGDPHPEK